jgi:hypothetical protein
MEPRDDAPTTGRRWLPWVAGVMVIVGAVVAVGVFGVQTLFIDDEVTEAGPTFASGAAAAPTTTVAPTATTGPPAEPASTPTTASPTTASPTTTAAPPAVREVARGTFTEVDHPGAGTAVILTDGTQTFVRFEDDFATDNGPDLFAVVYQGDRLIELAPLKGNRGSQNYELPADIDPSTVTSIGVWCKRFDSTFTTAQLS